jgi:tetratricopeptide (TPR) repeat protein
VLSSGGWCQLSPEQVAPPAQTGAQAFVFEQMITRNVYKSDGTGSRTSEARVRVLSPAGVQALGQLHFGYSSDNEQLSIDYVRVRKFGGELVSTPLDKAPEVSLQISKDAPVYTDYREKHISVAGLAPGDTLEYKITSQLIKPLAANQFWLAYSFNRRDEVQDERLIVEAPKGRELKIKSRQPYATEEIGATKIYTWKSSNVAKVSAKKESDAASSEEDAMGPDVQLSTFRNWQEVAQWYSSLLADRLIPGPEVKAKAEVLTQGAISNEEKERRIYDFVSKNIRYVSLSFGVGRYQPHSAAEVLHNEYGDCKDKHTLLAALLKSSGIDSHAVLIHSHNDLDRDVPAPSQFDHMITSLEGATPTWLDSTAGVAPFGLIPPTLRGKDALLIAPDRADPIVRVPENASVPGGETVDVDGQFNESGDLEAGFKLSLQGDQALIIRALVRGTPQPRWQELVQNISYFSGFGGEVGDVHIDNVEMPDLPLLISYHYSRKTYFAQDDRDHLSGRNTLPLPQVAIDSENVARLKKGQELRLQGPFQMIQKARLKFTSQQHPSVPIPVSVSRDYGSYTAKYELKDDELVAERIYVLKVRALPAARDKDLQSFLAAVNQDHGQEVVVKLSPPSVDAAIENSTDAVKLNSAARASLDANDYASAAKFAEKAVQVDPQSPDAWNNLGLAYLGQRRMHDAEKAFRKQIEVNPFDHWAYNNLGRVLEDASRNEDAIAAYRKQIEIVPLDQYAHKNLGVLLFRIQKFTEAVPELEAASQITPDDTSIKMILAQVYKLNGQGDKASALLSKLPVGPASSFMAGDIYKATVHEFDDPEATIRWAKEGLQRSEQHFQFDDNDAANLSAAAVSAFWAAMGWAYFRMNQLENSERYLFAAWKTSQSADVGCRLAQVYEKESKQALAMQMYAKALSGEGSKEGIFEKFDALAGDQRKATAMVQAAAGSLAAERTVTLQKTAAKRASAELLLIFRHGSQPEKVVFSRGSSALLDRYEATIKGVKFAVTYPDQTPQRITRPAILNCGLAGCAIVMLPVSPRIAVVPPSGIPGR